LSIFLRAFELSDFSGQLNFWTPPAIGNMMKPWDTEGGATVTGGSERPQDTPSESEGKQWAGLLMRHFLALNF
jgi:hypothetical protein